MNSNIDFSCSMKPSDLNNNIRSFMSFMKSNLKDYKIAQNNLPVKYTVGDLALFDTLPDNYRLANEYLGYFIKSGDKLEYHNDSNNASHAHTISSNGISIPISYVTGTKTDTPEREDHTDDVIYINDYTISDNTIINISSSNNGTEYKPKSVSLIPGICVKEYL